MADKPNATLAATASVAVTPTSGPHSGSQPFAHPPAIDRQGHKHGQQGQRNHEKRIRRVKDHADWPAPAAQTPSRLQASHPRA